MGAFTIYPAIDLRQGRVVRLRQGDPGQEKLYSVDPAATARKWLEAGAAWLHVVNLDGAFAEQDQTNYHALQVILGEAGRLQRATQFGGGLRSLEQVERVLSAGVQRAVLGTAALENPGLTAEAISRFGAERVAIALDARGGILQSHGWQADSRKEVLKVGQELAGLGVKVLIYTNVSRDGTGSGVDLSLSQALAAASGLQVIASGGAHSLEEVRQARQVGLEGIILGRALYEGIFTLEEAMKC